MRIRHASAKDQPSSTDIESPKTERRRTENRYPTAQTSHRTNRTYKPTSKIVRGDATLVAVEAASWWAAARFIPVLRLWAPPNPIGR